MLENSDDDFCVSSGPDFEEKDFGDGDADSRWTPMVQLNIKVHKKNISDAPNISTSYNTWCETVKSNRYVLN